jgi:hypothetical protein
LAPPQFLDTVAMYNYPIIQRRKYAIDESCLLNLDGGELGLKYDYVDEAKQINTKNTCPWALVMLQAYKMLQLYMGTEYVSVTSNDFKPLLERIKDVGIRLEFEEKENNIVEKIYKEQIISDAMAKDSLQCIYCGKRGDTNSHTHLANCSHVACKSCIELFRMFSRNCWICGESIGLPGARNNSSTVLATLAITYKEDIMKLLKADSRIDHESILKIDELITRCEIFFYVAVRIITNAEMKKFGYNNSGDLENDEILALLAQVSARLKEHCIFYSGFTPIVYEEVNKYTKIVYFAKRLLENCLCEQNYNQTDFSFLTGTSDLDGYYL